MKIKTVCLTEEEKEQHPSIHYSGSVIGMIVLGYWGRDDTIVRCDGFFYNLSINIGRQGGRHGVNV